jgi:hypothetical protein
MQMPAPADAAAAKQIPAPADPATATQVAGVIADQPASASAIASQPNAGQGAAHASPPDQAVARGLAEHGPPEHAVANGLDKQDPPQHPVADRVDGHDLPQQSLAVRIDKPDSPAQTAASGPRPDGAAGTDTQTPPQHADSNPTTTPPVASASAAAALRSEGTGALRRAAGTGFAPVVQPVAATIHVLTSRGAAHARLHLRPEELGGVEVALRTTADGGVSARLVADNPHAARVLSERLHELTGALARQGIALTDVEVRTAHDGASRDGRPSAAQHGRRRRTDGLDGVDDVAAAPATTQILVLDGGSIVDVLA